MALLGRPPVVLVAVPQTVSAPLDGPSHLLRVDGDAVCPRCLRWIRPTEYVRRTAYGPVQHEACPQVDV